MKLTKDNYELIMFDLTGRQYPFLSAVERQYLTLKQIEQDEFLRKEWELFQSTVLLPELEHSFEKKAALLKKETKVFAIPTWWSVGVAASIIIALFYFVPNLTKSGSSEIAPQPLTDEVSIEPEVEPSLEDDQGIHPEIEEPAPAQLIKPKTVAVQQERENTKVEKFELVDYSHMKLDSDLIVRSPEYIAYNTISSHLIDTNEPLVLKYTGGCNFN